MMSSSSPLPLSASSAVGSLPVPHQSVSNAAALFTEHFLTPYAPLGFAMTKLLLAVLFDMPVRNTFHIFIPLPSFRVQSSLPLVFGRMLLAPVRRFMGSWESPTALCHSQRCSPLLAGLILVWAWVIQSTFIFCPALVLTSHLTAVHHLPFLSNRRCSFFLFCSFRCWTLQALRALNCCCFLLRLSQSSLAAAPLYAVR